MNGFAASILVSACLILVPSQSHAQWLSLGLRGTGSLPSGAFADDQSSADQKLIEGAKNGFGYGLDVGVGVGMFGLYGGFDHIKFDCETTTCQSDGKYTLQGVAVGVKLSPASLAILRPFIKGGVTFNNMEGGYGGSSSNRLSTDTTPGYELGAGADLSFLGLFSLVPQVRYVGQKLKTKIPGVTAPSAEGQSVNYLTFDLGLTVHTPYSLMRRSR